MNCPSCGSPILIVVDSRAVPGSIRRRRECTKCSHRFTTYEVYEKQYTLLNMLTDLVRRKNNE